MDDKTLGAQSATAVEAAGSSASPELPHDGTCEYCSAREELFGKPSPCYRCRSRGPLIVSGKVHGAKMVALGRVVEACDFAGNHNGDFYPGPVSKALDALIAAVRIEERALIGIGNQSNEKPASKTRRSEAP